MLNISGINNGVVLDHIQAGKSMDIYHYLNLQELDCQVAIIKNAKSSKMGRKDIIKIEGSVELAPILSLTDAIVDIVETGATLKANGLVPIETVAPVSARLIVNTATMKLHKSQINDFIDRCEAELERDI